VDPVEHPQGCIETPPATTQTPRDREFIVALLLHAQLEGFIGPDALVRGWEQKQVLLAALRPRDRLRLLGLVRPLAPLFSMCVLLWRRQPE